MEIVNVGKERREVVTYVEEHAVTVKLTPHDIAQITAALGVTCTDDLRKSFVVRTDHINDSHEPYATFSDIYNKLLSENAFKE